jgi:aminoglycoside 6'-N-acetyltransferase I
MIRQAALRDTDVVTDLALKMWPGRERQELETAAKALLASETDAVFLYLDGGQPVAFVQCGLRNDYVEGTSDRPVGYLEAVFVDGDHRQRGIAGELLKHCEQWARGKGCAEFASDCELTNTESLAFHLHEGFREANRIICFAKRL